MKRWIDDIRIILEALRAIIAARRAGISGKLVIMTEEDHQGWMDTYRRIEQDNQTLQKVVHALIRGESACQWCEEAKECFLDKSNGCAGWWLKW